MRDHITDELISAYVDGELEGDELKLVEGLLAESPEHLQLLAEFQALRSSMWSLPSFSLPDDFNSRVVSQIDQLAPSSVGEPVQRVSRESKAGSWKSVVFAAASLAAVVAFTVMLSESTPERSTPVVRKSVTHPATAVYFKEIPQFLYVYDLTITPEGLKNNAIEKLLEKLRMGIDPGLALDPGLEKELMVIRASTLVPGATKAVPYKSDDETPKSSGDAKVEMIYVAGILGAISQLGEELQQLEDVGEEVSQYTNKFVIEPSKIRAMNRVHDSAREHVASSTNIVPSDAGQAFRLVFSFKLTNASVPGAAAIPTFGLDAEAMLSSLIREAAPRDVNAGRVKAGGDALEMKSQPIQSGVEGEVGRSSDSEPRGPENPATGSEIPGHVLLIIRHGGK